MRDPQRIGPLLERLRRAWEANPNLRLGQLIVNEIDETRLYFIEDEELIDALDGGQAVPR